LVQLLSTEVLCTAHENNLVQLLSIEVYSS
jgi:hypothetical protein